VADAKDAGATLAHFDLGTLPTTLRNPSSVLQSRTSIYWAASGATKTAPTLLAPNSASTT